jgi:hypothetical protein
MRIDNATILKIIVTSLFVIGSINQSITGPEKSETHEPIVVSTSPSDGDTEVARNIVIEIKFSEEPDSTFIQNSSFTLMQGKESVAGDINLDEFSHFEGIILSLTGITMKSGASLNGRMLAQADVTLDKNTIIEPLLQTTVQSPGRDE